jgi:hypothetical protein
MFMRVMEKSALLASLKAELAFIEAGGYHAPIADPWRARSTFQDSPICPNSRLSGDPVPCEECVLMQFVPADCRDARIPCHHIPLTEAGDTVDSAERWADEAELERMVSNWLRKTIAQLEKSEAVPET